VNREHEHVRVADNAGRGEADFAGHREIAAGIERNCPGWLVMWSPYCRVYYAYPCFSVPQGTVLRDADPGELVAEMRAVQKAAAQATRVVAASAGGGMWGDQGWNLPGRVSSSLFT
jgi:hypothetical protein